MFASASKYYWLHLVLVGQVDLILATFVIRANFLFLLICLSEIKNLLLQDLFVFNRLNLPSLSITFVVLRIGQKWNILKQWNLIVRNIVPI